MRILIVEDEFNLADVISDRLKKENYTTDISTDGLSGLDNAMTNIYDLIILDVMLPKMNGFDILKELKEKNITSKIIMLTAKSQIEDKLNGFDYGADDYITKPFHLEELVARINVQLRKNTQNITQEYLTFEDLRLSTKNNQLSCLTTNEMIEISCKEYMILEYLMINQKQIVSKENLYDKIWGYDNTIESNNLEAYLSFIRKKIKIIGSKVKIKPIRGLGYKLEI
ncbi:MAG: response regulator transcription factor [Bacilli bacterium]